MHRTSPYTISGLQSSGTQKYRPIQDVITSSTANVSGSKHNPIPRQIAVSETASTTKAKPALTPFMIDPKYLKSNDSAPSAASDVWTRNREPAVMYSRLNGVETAERIRRPRQADTTSNDSSIPIPVSTPAAKQATQPMPSQKTPRKGKGVALAPLAAIGAAIAVFGHKMLDYRDAAADKLAAYRASHGTAGYTLAGGARAGMFGKNISPLKTIVPLLAIVTLLGLGLYNVVLNRNTDTAAPNNPVVIDQDSNTGQPGGTTSSGTPQAGTPKAPNSNGPNANPTIGAAAGTDTTTPGTGGRGAGTTNTTNTTGPSSGSGPAASTTPNPTPAQTGDPTNTPQTALGGRGGGPSADISGAGAGDSANTSSSPAPATPSQPAK